MPMTSGRSIEARGRDPAPAVVRRSAAEAHARVVRLEPPSRLLARRALQRLRRVPWQHVWIVALAAALLLFALFGFFREY